jgi:hypothetical protein
MGKGYRLEHCIESEFMRLASQTLDMPIHQRTYRVPTSGAMRGEKGDVRTNLPQLKTQFTIECKDRRQITKKNGRIFRLSQAWIDKAWAEAGAENRWPMFVIAFKGSMQDRIWCVLDTEIYAHIFESARSDSGVQITFKKKSYILIQNDLKGHDHIGFGNGRYVLIKLETIIAKLMQTTFL